jgi:hypothetical protein
MSLNFLQNENSIGILLLLGAIVFLVAWIMYLEWRLHSLFKGGQVSSLEHMIRGLADDRADHTRFQQEMEAYLSNVEKRLRRSMQGSAVTRFNPFKGDGSGGNQSSTTALLSEEGDGLVMTILYARDRVSAYTKPIERFVSPIELTEEEQEAILKVQQKLDDSRK